MGHTVTPACPSEPVALPPKRVLEAFRVHGELDPLPGGQRPAWRCGDVVLKPLDTSEQMLEWQSRVLTPLTHLAALRGAPLLRATDGSLGGEAWTALPYLSGSQARGRWAAVGAAGARCHA